jgi:hypothetical protein
MGGSLVHLVAEGFAVGVLADERGVEDVGGVGGEGRHPAGGTYRGTLGVLVVPSLHPHIIAAGVVHDGAVGMSGALDEEALLRRLSGELARLHSWDDVTAYIMGAAVQLLGGNTGSLCLLTPDRRELEIVTEHGYSLEVTAVWTRFRVDAPLPASEAVRTGTAVFLTSPEDRDARYPIFLEQPVVQDAAYAIEPLMVDGRAIGALVIGFEAPREFSAEDQRLMAAAAARCAQALDSRRRP